MENKKLCDIATITMGQSPKSSDYIDQLEFYYT